jgi:predicted alpha/beta-fold hydrolase
MHGYRAPAWLPGGNLQTIWSALGARTHAGERPRFVRERWTAPDGDFIDVDFLSAAPEGAPLLVVFHGLEGSSASPNVLAFAEAARRRGWALAVPHFRGCSGELNHAPRAYHSGDHEEVGWILQRLRARTHAPLRAAGISLGGNALLRWAQEAGEAAWPIARAVASVSSPIDLAAAGRAIDSGWNRLVYARMFLATMKPRALERLARHPGLFDGARVRGARTMREFDDAFTAPLHGFAGVDDYYARASAKPGLAAMRLPALVLNARNDPFVPAASLPRPHEVSASVTLWQPAHGGHCGFPAGAPPAHVHTMPEAVIDWLAAR